MSEKEKKLYDTKGKLFKRMQDISELSKNRTLTEAEETEFDSINEQLKFVSEQIWNEDRKYRKEADEAFRKLKAGAHFRGNGQEIFEEQAPKEIMDELSVFNRSSTQNMREWYRERHESKEELNGLTFGSIAKAFLKGPKNDRETRALSEGVSSAGGYTVPTQIAVDIIDRARAKSHLARLGMQIVPMGDGTKNVSRMAKLTSGVTVQWRAENAQITDSDPSFAAVDWSFKSVAALIKVSNELLQDSVNIAAAIDREFIGAFSAELDRVGLVGSGVGAEPQGIKNYTGVNIVSMGTNGAAISNYSQVLNAIQLVRENNLEDPTGLIMSPRTLKSFEGLMDTTNQPMQRPFSLANLPFLSTSKISNAETQGTSNVASSIYMGDFTQLYMGMRLDLQIIPLKERYADYNQTAFLAVLRADIKPYYEQAFSKIIGVL